MSRDTVTMAGEIKLGVPRGIRMIGPDCWREVMGAQSFSPVNAQVLRDHV